MEIEGENGEGILGGKRETRIGIGIIATGAMNKTTRIEGAVVRRRETLLESLIVEIGVVHPLMLTLVILDTMPHCIRSLSL